MNRRFVGRGFTLIELIVFIVVASVLATTLYSAFLNALKGAPQAATFSKASDLAQERMELILAQRHQTKFANFTADSFDPCTTLPASTEPPCINIPVDFTVNASLLLSWNGNTNFKIITVTVNGRGVFDLQTLVANY